MRPNIGTLGIKAVAETYIKWIGKMLKGIITEYSSNPENVWKRCLKS